MNKAVIDLGSNLNPEENILAARFLLSKIFTVLKESSFRKTRPVKHPLAEKFLNGCVYIETSLDSQSLKAELKRLEKELGRDHEASDSTAHPIDLDIVIFNNQVIDKSFYERPFLKETVLQLLPGLKF